jgi:hypothetical protein
MSKISHFPTIDCYKFSYYAQRHRISWATQMDSVKTSFKEQYMILLFFFVRQLKRFFFPKWVEQFFHVIQYIHLL